MSNSAFSAAALALSGGCTNAEKNHKDGDDLASIDAVETAARIASGSLTALEAVNAAIDRARRTDPKVNAIAFPTYDNARAMAESAAGVLGGVPTFMKDLDDVTGTPTGFGSRAFPGYKGTKQVPLIDAFLDMGVVSLGKSTTPEFGLSASTESLSTGPTRNPWNTDYSTGGSSGGAAALVAAGVVPIAHASDGGGSIRIPASCCGNVGLKVSNGRFPIARPNNVGPLDISVHGLQSRTVRDTAAVFAAMENIQPEANLPEVGLVSGASRDRLKIGLLIDGMAGADTDPEVANATLQVADELRALGHRVEEAPVNLSQRFQDDFLLYWAAFADSAVSFWESQSGMPRNGFAFEPLTLGLAELYQQNKEKLAESLNRLQQVESLIEEQVFSKFDVLLTPVLSAPPPRIGWLGGGVHYDTIINRLTNYVQFTALYNIAGTPAISLPLSMSVQGLPIGAMFGSTRGREQTLLQLAYELEDAMPWRDRRPPLFG